MDSTLLRSLFFLPAAEKRLSKVADLHPDIFIFDLEDSIQESQKSAALDLLCEFLENNPVCSKSFVRVNQSYWETETARLNHLPILGYMLPKAESYEQITAFKDKIGEKQIIALVETAMGIIYAAEIASHPAVNSLAFGAEDYTSSIGMKNVRDNILTARISVIQACAAYHKKSFDTVSWLFRDTDAYSEEAEYAANLGFTGKLLIHPSQIDITNNAFSTKDIEYCKKVIAEFEKNESGVLIYDGKVYERPHIERLKKYIQN